MPFCVWYLNEQEVLDDAEVEPELIGRGFVEEVLDVDQEHLRPLAVLPRVVLENIDRGQRVGPVLDEPDNERLHRYSSGKEQKLRVGALVPWNAQTR